MIGLYILCIALLGLSYISSNRNIFAPAVITSAVWFVCLSLFFLLHHNLPPLSTQFITGLSLWMTLLCLSSLFMQSLSVNSKIRNPSRLMRNIYFYISIATFPLLLYFAYTAIKTGTTGNWALDLRRATLGISSHDSSEAYTPFYFLIWNSAFLIELLYASKRNLGRLIILAFFCIAFGVLTMSKAMMLNFFTMTLTLLVFKKVINSKHVLISIVALLLFFIGLQSIRHSAKLDDDQTEDMFVTYALGSMSSFETLKPKSSYHSGENVFRLYYVLGYKTGLSNVKPIYPILPWVQKPIATNTYTCMYPLFKDYGYWGIGIFAVLLGFFYGFLFKKAEENDPLFILLYTYFVYVILMQFSGDVFFTNLAGHIKMYLLLIIPFLASKHHLFEKK